MSNWTESKLLAIMPEDKVPLFLSFFSSSKQSSPSAEADYKFPRTYLNSYSKQAIDKGMVKLKINFSCAWSIYSCLIQKRKETESTDYCPLTLEEGIDKCDIATMDIVSREEGNDLGETLKYNRSAGGHLNYSSYEITSAFDDDESD